MGGGGGTGRGRLNRDGKRREEKEGMQGSSAYTKDHLSI